MKELPQKKVQRNPRWLCVLFFFVGVSMILKVALPHAEPEKIDAHGQGSGAIFAAWQILAVGVFISAVAVYAFFSTKNEERA